VAFFLLQGFRLFMYASVKNPTLVKIVRNPSMSNWVAGLVCPGRVCSRIVSLLYEFLIVPEQLIIRLRIREE